MTGYRVSPRDVEQTLGRVRAEADGLGVVLQGLLADASGAAGGSQIVADALGGFVEAAQDDMGVVADRLESAPGAMVRAVAAILEGDEEMARTHTRGLSQAESFQPPRLGYPSGTLGPPAPAPLGDRFGGYDPSRFGAAQPSLVPSAESGPDSDPEPAFGPNRFGARPGPGADS